MRIIKDIDSVLYGWRALVHDMCKSGYIDGFSMPILSLGTFHTSLFIFRRVEKSTANKQNRNSHRETHLATFQYAFP